MKLPLAPPPLNKLFESLSPEALSAWHAQPQPALPEGRYLHWDELRHRTPPHGITHEQWWLAIKIARQVQAQPLPLKDKNGQPFIYTMPAPVIQALHFIDRDASGQILMDGPVASPQDRDRYLVSSLIEEAITSSQLEGASTTRRVAEDMLRAGRRPRTTSERMIFNNYQAMRHIRAIQDQALTPAAVLELHRMLTLDTLDDPADAGRLRQADDIHVVDPRDGQTLHIPPSAVHLPERLEKLCAFANGTEKDVPYIHPVVRAILLHFMLGYDHPFVDGNGRTARALFYWAMSRQGYWLMEYLSISNILRQAPGQYARAYLHTETDGADTTYFLLHQLDVIHQAIDALKTYLAEKSHELRATEKLLRSVELRARCNHRQIALLGHALKHEDAIYTVESHRASHAIAYATARSDLLALVDMGLLHESKQGNRWVFTVPDDLHRKLKK
ncbi:MAG: Fic family protein [Thiobacillus sp.]|nr:Fic family protein [Thiobacillus sp.]